MHRVDSPGNVAGQFSAGDPPNGVQPTQIDAAIMNAMQENICEVIESAGIALVKGDHDQLRAAIAAMITNATLTAAQILARLITVDGSGSGLDADLLRGLHWTSGQNVWFGDVVSSRGDGTGVVYLGDAGDKYIFYDNAAYRMPAAPLYADGGLVWTGTNDGSGSGLDADLLDGYQASAFLGSSGSNGNGYWEQLAGGLIIQRGRLSFSTTESIMSHDFPIAFTDASSIVLALTGIFGSYSEDNWPLVYGNPTMTGFQFVNNGTTGSEGAYGLHWTAIGR